MNGLTLVEVLVVLLIISILVAILFPVFGAAKERAKVANCVSNASQIGKSIFLYASDSDDHVPNVSTHDINTTIAKTEITTTIKGDSKKWRLLLLTYSKSEDIFYCPSDSFARKPGKVPGSIEESSAEFTSYESMFSSNYTVPFAGVLVGSLSTMNSQIDLFHDITFQVVDERAMELQTRTSHKRMITYWFPDGRTKHVTYQGGIRKLN